MVLTDTTLDSMTVDELIDWIRDPPEPGFDSDALEELLRRQEPRRAAVLESILADTRADLRLRLTSAAALGREATGENEAGLLRQLPRAEERVLARMAQALGRIGGQVALRALEARTAEGRAGRAVRFARSLIAYRLRLDAYRLDPVDGDLILEAAADAPACATGRLSPSELAHVAETARGELGAIRLSGVAGSRVRCEGSEFAIVPVEGFQTAKQLATLAEASALPFVALEKPECPGGYGVSEYFFAHPDGNGGAVLTGVQPDGAVCYSGTATPGKDGLAFRIRTVDCGYAAAVEMKGVFAPGKKEIVFEVARSEGRIRRERHPRRPV